MHHERTIQDYFYHLSQRVVGAWCPTLRKGTTGIGFTFETFIGVEENNDALPDFGHIEIKTSRDTTSSKLSLFTLTPRHCLHELSNSDSVGVDLHERFGSIDERGYKTLYTTVRAGRWNSYKNEHSFTLKVCREDKRVYLLCKEFGKEDVVYSAFYTFSEIQTSLSKLTTMALVPTEVRTERSKEYFLYKDPVIYQSRGLKGFIDAVEAGVIVLDLRFGVYKDAEDESRDGKMHDHGACFRIGLSHLNVMFEGEKLQLGPQMDLFDA